MKGGRLNTMPEPKSDLAERQRGEDILTLSEAASLLRVDESALAELAAQGAVPAQQIGSEWRFLKEALFQWLHFGPRFQEVIRFAPPPWHLELVAERLASLLEQRLLGRVEAARQPVHKPGSKQAVRKHVGVFKDDSDLEETLAGLAAIREGGSAEGEE
jgi:excisionase family DNA binding protein